MNNMMKPQTKTDFSAYTWRTFSYGLEPASPRPSYFSIRSPYNVPFGFNAPAEHQQQSGTNRRETHQQIQDGIHPQGNFENSPPNRASRNYRTSHENIEVPDYHLQPRQTDQQTFVPGEREFTDDAIIYPQPHDAPPFSPQQPDPPKRNVNSRNTPPKKGDTAGENCIYNLCESAPDYPEDLIVDQLSRSKQFDAFFNNTFPDILNKVLAEPENLCGSTKNTTFPRSAVNTKLVKRYIANVGEYRQGVKTEICNNDGEECMFGENFPLEYKSICVQRFTTIPLVAFDDDKNLLVESFDSPSCCVCMYKAA
ncbi:spz [Trypoxylus dichotomus]